MRRPAPSRPSPKARAARPLRSSGDPRRSLRRWSGPASSLPSATAGWPSTCPPRSSSSVRRAGARRLRHQRRAAAGQAGRPARREVAEIIAARLRRVRRHRPGRRRRPRLPQHHPGRRHARRGRARHRRGRRRPTGAPTSWPASRSTSSSSRPTRPGRCTSAAPGGPRSATRWPGCSRPAAPRSPASTTSTTTAADRPVRPLAAGRGATGEPVPEDGYGGAYIDEIAEQVVARHPGVLSLPDDEAQEVFRARRRRADVRRDQAVAARLRRRLRRLLPRGLAARVRRGRQGVRPLKEQGTCTSPTAPGGCARPTSATTRTASGHQERRRADLLRRRLRLLPRQARPRLRPVHLHARRRPPRLRRAAARRRRPAFGDDPDRRSRC